jgi:hypothetical protein
MSKPSKMLIEANFDIDQVSPMLECKFKRYDNAGNLLSGKNAGSVVFAEGEEVSLQVNAGADMGAGGSLPFKSFKIIDCTITTRPSVYRCGPNENKTVYAPPSPFKTLLGSPPRGATVILPAVEFKEASVVVTPEYYRQGLAWSGSLTVGQLKGRRWRLTLMVTTLVEIENSEPQLRVYEIDPEIEVDNGGGGGNSPMEDCPPVMMAQCEVDPEIEVDNGGGGSH